jgi:hypothetical protein
MSTVEHFDARITARPNRGAAIDASDDKDNVIALRRSAAGSSFLWEMQLFRFSVVRPCARFTPFAVKSATSRTARHPVH